MDDKKRLWSPAPLIIGLGTIAALQCTERAFGEWAANSLAFALLGFVVGWLAADVRAHMMEDGNG